MIIIPNKDSYENLNDINQYQKSCKDKQYMVFFNMINGYTV